MRGAKNEENGNYMQVGYGLEAADKLAADGISAEVINLRSLKPLDRDTILKSVSKTHRFALAPTSTCSCMSPPRPIRGLLPR